MVLLEAADIPFLPMNDRPGVLADPHLSATGFFTMTDHPSEGPLRQMRMSMQWSDSSPDAPRPAPRLGEHSREVLQQAGFDAAQIDALVAEGAVGAEGVAHTPAALPAEATP
jgi:formyl-CoA transferase